MKHSLVKIIILFLCFTLALSLYYIKPGYCQTALQILPRDSTVQVCSNFEITVAVSDVHDMFAFDIKLAYDTNVMDALNIEILPPFNSWPIILPPQIREEEGWLQFAASLLPTMPPFSGSGGLANITFHCTAESTASVLHLFDDHLVDPQNFDIPHSSHDAFVTQLQPSEVHDVAVTDVTPAKTVVCQTMTMKIYVTVANLGVFSETFDVTVKAVPSADSPIIIGTQSVSLAMSETKTLTFIWTTADAPMNTYTINAVADTVEGEVNISNNLHSDGQVNVTILGDINKDNVVSIFDASQVGINWMEFVPPANPNADINDDNLINILDATIIGLHWMEMYP